MGLRQTRNDDRFVTMLEELVATAKLRPGGSDTENARDAAWRLLRDGVLERRDVEQFEKLWTVRNSLVHDSHNGHPLVHVTTEAMKAGQRLYGMVCDRLLTVDIFHGNVVVIHPDERLVEACRLMGEHDYSALPVLDERGVVGLLSSQDIVSWAGIGLGGVGLLEDARVADVMHSYATLDYVVIPRTRPAREVPSMFSCAVSAGRPLGAALVTSTGQEDQRLLGIITPWDLARLTTNDQPAPPLKAMPSSR